MMQPQESALFEHTRRVPARIHAVPAPKSSLIRFVDAIDAPVALLSREARITTMNGPARDFFIGRVGIPLRDAIESLARHVIGDRRSGSAPNRAHAIETGDQRFMVTIVLAGNDLATQDIGAMALLRREPLSDAEPRVTENSLAQRFALTAQEARVAVMLADYRTNRDIAARLGVSIHTARRCRD
jgi:hypothetical protein